MRDLKEGILGELDYLREAESQQRFYDEFEGHAFIRVPRVYHELTTPRVLVQEYIAGRPFSSALEWPQAERDRIGEIIFRYAFGSIYRHYLFNGDPHPGNYLLLDDGSVAFVDYGCVAEFSRDDDRRLRRDHPRVACTATARRGGRASRTSASCARTRRSRRTSCTTTCTGTGRRSSRTR